MEIAAGTRPPSVELSLSTRPDLPAGRYFLVVLVALNADPWIYRRPIWIETGPCDPGSGGSRVPGAPT